MRKYLVLCVLACVSLTVSAQGKYAGTTIYDRVGSGEDSIAVLSAITLYREELKAKNYAEAYSQWLTVFNKAPLAQGRTYTDGAIILQQLLYSTQDEAKKKEYFDMLMKVYDQRLANLDDLNSFATAKSQTTRGNILTRKASDYFSYAPNTADKLETAYKMFREGINDMGVNEVQSYVLYNFIVCSDARYKSNPTEAREDFINDYLTVKEVCENLLEQAKEYAFTDSIATQEDSIQAAELEAKAAKIVEQYQPTFLKCEELFYASDAANCSDLDKIYAAKVEANKEDRTYLKQVLNVLSNFECDSSALYTKIFDVLYPKKEKKVSGGSLDFYLEEYAEETGASRKAKLAVSIAQMYYKQGRLGDCEKWCRTALSHVPSYGNAYLMIANCIVRKAPGANQNVDHMFNRSLYFCLAIDKCNRAKAVDPACASQANRQIASYRSNLFPRSEAFMMGKKEGMKCTILGETTTLKLH
ncbi:MAG: hypothetical protein MJY59_00955 [Bacteroidaceae bacterium]|nr:hypothetical protein [Bacteroidaceae bacterium]